MPRAIQLKRGSLPRPPLSIYDERCVGVSGALF